MERKQEYLTQFAIGAGRLARWTLALGLAGAGLMPAAPFGKVVAIGGQAADLAIDEARNVLYIANFTANRIEEMSLATGVIRTSMNVSSQPGSVAISPDGKYLVVGHYGNFQSASTANNAMTVIDLDSRARQTFAMGSPVLGVAFGIDGRALIVTSTDFQLFDPATGATQVLDTITGLQAKSLPAVNANAPSSIVAATVAASADGRSVYGLSDVFRFYYDVEHRALRVLGYSSSPTMGPRAVSVSRDGSLWVGGWVLSNREGTNLAQFGDPNGALDVGGHALDSTRGLLYSEVPTNTGGSLIPGVAGAQAPVLQVLDSDNLRVRDRLQLAEHLAGKAVLNQDGTVMYAISASGVTILPVGTVEQAPRVASTEQDLIFRGNFCDRRVTGQDIAIVNPGGGAVDFSLSSTTAGLRFSPSSGVTPATVRVSIDPAAFQNLKGTLSAQITINSTNAVNLARPIRVLINNREPDQRGTIVNVAGKLVDMLSDPERDRFYILRQDTNEVLVFDGVTYSLQARLRTSNTPTQMAITFDRRYLLVGHDNAQIATMYDLETLEQLAPVRFPGGHYPRSIAATGRTILAATRVAGATHVIDKVDLASRTATQLPSLGVYENNVDKSTVLIATPNGGRIMAVQASGGLLLYDATADTFTVSRKESDKLTGAIAASSFDQFVVGNKLLNASLVPVRTLDSSTVQSAGFMFVDQIGFRTTAGEATAAGVIQRVDLPAGAVSRATRMAEAPYLGDTEFPFTRTVAPLYSRNVIVNLTTSGFTVLPWNYDAAVAAPQIQRVVSAADGTENVATGGLVSLLGREMSPVNLATKEMPLPTALGDSCLTVNGVPTPMMFVSPTQLNAQIPYTIDGNATIVLRTPGGISDNYYVQIRAAAPTVFRSAVPGSGSATIATVVRKKNGELVTLSNPVHRGEAVVVYLTGMGRTFPSIEAGVPGPNDPPLPAQIQPIVSIGGKSMGVGFAGLSPGQVGVYQIEAFVPGDTPLGFEVPLVIDQSGGSTTVKLRVVD
jgi:uncharacterized protein (TIGR03437 family)